MNLDNVILVASGQPGPILAIFAGVHGNERAGVYALQQLATELKLTKGKVYLVLANPPAIEADVRMLGKNLNRCFFEGNIGNTPEDMRACELMQLLDGCDALLDLHMFYDDNGEPFVICEDNAVELAQIFDVNIISTNWTQVEPGGTDGYMFTKDKIGICVECGPHRKSHEYTEFAKNSVYQFLTYFDMVDTPVEYSRLPKRIIRAEQAVHKSSESFVLEPGFINFEKLAEGQLIAMDGNTRLTAKAGDCIIFPHYGARLNEECYILGHAIAD